MAPYSCFHEHTKKDIDDITSKIINILKSGSGKLKRDGGDQFEREKNILFRRKYGIPTGDVGMTIDDVKQLLLENLTPQDISDVQYDMMHRPERTDSKMYIYFLSPRLKWEEKGITQHGKVNVYTKVEIIRGSKNTQNKDVLLISLHEPEYNMERRYEMLQ